MSDPVPASTRTIWLAAAGLFGLAFLVGLFKGSIFLAIVLLLIAGACVYQSRRAPRDDGANQKDKDEDDDAEEDEADDESRDRDEPAGRRRRRRPSAGQAPLEQRGLGPRRDGAGTTKAAPAGAAFACTGVGGLDAAVAVAAGAVVVGVAVAAVVLRDAVAVVVAGVSPDGVAGGRRSASPPARTRARRT